MEEVQPAGGGVLVHDVDCTSEASDWAKEICSEEQKEAILRLTCHCVDRLERAKLVADKSEWNGRL